MGNLYNVFLVILMSMLPISELRGAIPLGINLGFTPESSTIISIVSNAIIVPILLLIIRPLFTRLKYIRNFKNLIERYESRAANKIKNYRKYRLMGLFLLVAVPLPTTGVYTGCVAAVIMNIQYKNALAAIVGGVVVAGIIMYLLSLGFLGGMALMG